MMYGFWIFSPMEFRSVTMRVRYPYGNLSRHVSSLWKCGWEGSGRRTKELEMKIDVEHVWFNNCASRLLHIILHNHYHVRKSNYIRHYLLPIHTGVEGGPCALGPYYLSEPQNAVVLTTKTKRSSTNQDEYGLRCTESKNLDGVVV